MNIIDAKGKPRRGLSLRGWRFAIGMADRYRKGATPADEATLETVARRVGLTPQQASKLTAHPEYQGLLSLIQNRAIEKSGLNLAQVQANLLRNRAIALGDEPPGPNVGSLEKPDLHAANRADELLAKSAGFLVEKTESKSVNVNVHLDGKSVADIQRRRRELGLDAPNA